MGDTTDITADPAEAGVKLSAAEMDKIIPASVRVSLNFAKDTGNSEKDNSLKNGPLLSEGEMKAFGSDAERVAGLLKALREKTGSVVSNGEGIPGVRSDTRGRAMNDTGRMV